MAIGASTGGPSAVLEVLRQLPATYPLPILLVIHISRLFANPLVEWLDKGSPLPVVQATDGAPLPEWGMGKVLVAPPDRHLIVSRGQVQLTDEAERHSCRPSVDVLFESLAREFGDAAAACLLTGMGKDGASGLLAVRQAGGLALAQDEETSVVFGMPREAILMGAANRVLPLDHMAAVLRSLAEP